MGNGQVKWGVGAEISNSIRASLMLDGWMDGSRKAHPALHHVLMGMNILGEGRGGFPLPFRTPRATNLALPSPCLLLPLSLPFLSLTYPI
jgi:hypothetical protein